MNISIPKDLKEKLEQHCRKTGATKSGFIRSLLYEEFGCYNSKEKK